MTQENRENMHRAIGIIEGVSWVTDNDAVCGALMVACEILSAVMKSEEKANES